LDASRGTAGRRVGSRRTSSASSMEFSSNTGTFFRTRPRERNPRAVYPCSEAVSPSDAGPTCPIFTSQVVLLALVLRSTTHTTSGSGTRAHVVAIETTRDREYGQKPPNPLRIVRRFAHGRAGLAEVPR